MPYPRESYFNPSQHYMNKWSLVPQGMSLTVSGFKTKSMYAELSSAIPIYYILMFSAISFDVYLGFAVLAKSGVNLALIFAGVILDFFLAILPFLLASKIDSRHYIKNENKIFKTLLECKTRKYDEVNDDETFRIRVQDGTIALNKYRKDQKTTRTLKYIFNAIILAIAVFKIYTFYAVLPPGMSFFSIANGKIVLIFSLLCALFHIIGSEKAFAHFIFWIDKNKIYEKQMEQKEAGKTNPSTYQIPYIGQYKPAKYGNTELVVDKNGMATIKYIHIVWDDEINQLVIRQGDQNARQGVAIACKELQIF